jgi:CO dehydrogenase/acetyl-CoA synthase alpha subunit
MTGTRELWEHIQLRIKRKEAWIATASSLLQNIRDLTHEETQEVIEDLLKEHREGFVE